MDLNQLNQQINVAVNRWLQATVEYFSNLSQMEMYGWGAFCLGFVLFIIGILLF